jgi:hypothetical protein
MSDQKPVFDAARHCDAMASTLGLVITEEQRPAVLQFLSIAKTMAAIVFLAPLDEAAFEPAGVFHAGRAGDGVSA